MRAQCVAWALDRNEPNLVGVGTASGKVRHSLKFALALHAPNTSISHPRPRLINISIILFTQSTKTRHTAIAASFPEPAPAHAGRVLAAVPAAVQLRRLQSKRKPARRRRARQGPQRSLHADLRHYTVFFVLFVFVLVVVLIVRRLHVGRFLGGRLDRRFARSAQTVQQ